MLENIKIGCKWIFQIIIGYLDISNFRVFRKFTCIYGLYQDTNCALLVYKTKVLAAEWFRDFLPILDLHIRWFCFIDESTHTQIIDSSKQYMNFEIR